MLCRRTRKLYELSPVAESNLMLKVLDCRGTRLSGSPVAPVGNHARVTHTTRQPSPAGMVTLAPFSARQPAGLPSPLPPPIDGGKNRPISNFVLFTSNQQLTRWAARTAPAWLHGKPCESHPRRSWPGHDSRRLFSLAARRRSGAGSAGGQPGPGMTRAGLPACGSVVSSHKITKEP